MNPNELSSTTCELSSTMTDLSLNSYKLYFNNNQRMYDMTYGEIQCQIMDDIINDNIICWTDILQNFIFNDNIDSTIMYIREMPVYYEDGSISTWTKSICLPNMTIKDSCFCILQYALSSNGELTHRLQNIYDTKPLGKKIKKIEFSINQKWDDEYFSSNSVSVIVEKQQ